MLTSRTAGVELFVVLLDGASRFCGRSVAGGPTVIVTVAVVTVVVVAVAVVTVAVVAVAVVTVVVVAVAVVTAPVVDDVVIGRCCSHTTVASSDRSTTSFLRT